MTVSGHFQATVVLIHVKEFWYPLFRGLCGSLKRAGQGEEKMPCSVSVSGKFSPKPTHIALIRDIRKLKRHTLGLHCMHAFTHTYRMFRVRGSKLQVGAKNSTTTLRRIINRYVATSILTYVRLDDRNRKVYNTYIFVILQYTCT